MNGKLAATVAGVIDAREVASWGCILCGLGYSDAANKAAALRMIGNYGNLQFSATSAQFTQSELTSQVAAFEALLQGGKLYRSTLLLLTLLMCRPTVCWTLCVTAGPMCLLPG